MGHIGRLIISTKGPITHTHRANREAATYAMGNMMEAFISPRSPIQPREFDHMNRTFTTKVRWKASAFFFLIL